MSTTIRGAVIVQEHRTLRHLATETVEPLTLALALSLGIGGAVLGWHAHAIASLPVSAKVELKSLPRMAPTAAADQYVDALCSGDIAYVRAHTGEAAGRMPWEPRLSDWALPCTRQRYLGALVDRLGRDQFVFTLRRPDGTEVLYVVTIGDDGLVAGID